MANTTNELKTTLVDGFKIPFKQFDGINYKFWTFIPDNITEHLQDRRDAAVRNDDVVVCTYPRSGTNWTNEIVGMLLASSTDYLDGVPEFIEMVPKNKLAEMESPRLLLSHFPFEFLPKQFADKGRLICVFRNPKDLAVSFHEFMLSVNFAEYDGNFDDFLKLFYSGDLPGGSWYDHVQGWERVMENKSAHALLILYYEDMKKDLRGHVDKIAKFLGIPYNDKLFGEITNKCDFQNMYKFKTSNISELVRNFSRNKSNYLYRKGEVGTWKNWFTVAQNEEFDSIYKERMKNSKLTFTYN